MDPKMILKTREDVKTRPIEVNVQSADVSEKEKLFFTEQDDETEEIERCVNEFSCWEH